MLIKTKGIVFRKLKYGETSLIVDVFTEEHGLMSYIVGGVRKPNTRMGIVLLQLMAIVEIVAYHSEKSKLHRIKEAQSGYVFRNIPGDVRKNAIILFMAELCSKVIRQTERNTDLYKMIEDSITALDQATDHFAEAHLLFMIRLADILGFGPEERHDQSQIYFNLLDGSFCSALPSHAYFIREADLFNRYLIAARKESHTELIADRISRNRMLDTLLLYFQLHIEKMPEMHAHKVLREVL